VDALAVNLPLVRASLAPADRPRFVAMIAYAVVADHDIDIQVTAEGLRYTILVNVIGGDLVVDEAVFIVTPLPREECLMWMLLFLRVSTTLDGIHRWRARRAPLEG
jgi:hypothetical protein